MHFFSKRYTNAKQENNKEITLKNTSTTIFWETQRTEANNKLTKSRAKLFSPRAYLVLDTYYT